MSREITFENAGASGESAGTCRETSKDRLAQAWPRDLQIGIKQRHQVTPMHAYLTTLCAPQRLS